METVTLKVRGMSRMGRVISVKRVLEAIAGVTDAEVSLDKAEATMRYDADRRGTVQGRDRGCGL